MWKHDLYILGSRIDPVNIGEAIKYCRLMMIQPSWRERRQHQVVTVNPEIVMKTLGDDSLRYLIDKASLSVPDGFGLIIAAKILGERIDNRVTGVDLMLELCRQAEQEKWPIFLVGGYEASAKTAKRLLARFPKLIIAGTDPGLDISADKGKIIYDQNDNKKILAIINRTSAKLLFVAFGAPKQEKWIAENLNSIPKIKLAIGVGGAFDFISGRINRAPVWLRNLGLEWFFRLIQQPRRLPRIFNATLKFLTYVIICKLRIKFYYRPNVAGLILNKLNQVLLVSPARRRWLAWQFPQGGVDRGETEESAILREMSEELGTDKFSILAKIPKIHQYIWPQWAQCAQCYKGQSQTLFILRFMGNDQEFNLKKEAELKAFQWIDREKVLALIDQPRRSLAEKALIELDKLL